MNTIFKSLALVFVLTAQSGFAADSVTISGTHHDVNYGCTSNTPQAISVDSPASVKTVSYTVNGKLATLNLADLNGRTKWKIVACDGTTTLGFITVNGSGQSATYTWSAN